MTEYGLKVGERLRIGTVVLTVIAIEGRVATIKVDALYAVSVLKAEKRELPEVNQIFH